MAGPVIILMSCSLVEYFQWKRELPAHFQFASVSRGPFLDEWCSSNEKKFRFNDQTARTRSFSGTRRRRCASNSPASRPALASNSTVFRRKVQFCLVLVMLPGWYDPQSSYVEIFFEHSGVQYCTRSVTLSFF